MKTLALGFLVSATFALAASAETLSGSAAVVDGDTIILQGTKIRLHGIDAPEAGQKCQKAGGGSWRCGQEAMDRLEILVHGGVVCRGDEYDGYNRLIAVCYKADGTDIDQIMVEEGYAWAFRKYSDSYAVVEDLAKSKKFGIWQAKTETPWDYRAAKWSAAQQQAPEGCPIKGNISSNGHIYHAPWSPWYAKTKIDASKGERWFCSEREAIDAGWTAPTWR